MAGDLELLGERIAEQAAHFDAAMHRLLADLRAFDDGGGWAAQGARSCAHWLSWRVGWGLGTAREHVRTAHALATLPAVDRELEHGRLSYSKVRAITRVATPENEETLVEQAKLTTASQLETICRKYATVRRQDTAANPDDDYDRRRVSRMDLSDGMVRITAVLHADEAAAVWAALEHGAKQLRRHAAVQTCADVPAGTCADTAAEMCADVPAETCADVPAETPGDVPTETCADVPAETHTAPPAAGKPVSAWHEMRPSAAHRTPPRRALDRADALVALAHAYLRGDAPERVPVEVIVAVPLETLAHAAAAEPSDVACTRDGTCISAHAARRLTCDAGIVQLVEDEQGNPLSVGRKTRSIPGAIKRAVLARDGHRCQFPGCTNGVYLEGHHIVHWAHGGAAELGNLVSTSFHHRFVHECDYTVELGSDGSATFRDHNGRVVPPVPPPAQPRDLGWGAIRARNRDLSIRAATNEPQWDGFPVDYVNVIDALVVADGLV
jgi:hypothetical protein